MEYLEGRTLVHGRDVCGTLTSSSLAVSPDSILLVEQLTPQDYPRIRVAMGVICEDGGSMDHASVICRILGKPVVQVPRACEALHPGEVVTMMPTMGRVYNGRRAATGNVPVGSAPSLQFVRRLASRSQVSIVGESEVKKANMLGGAGYAPALFFVREELIWLSRGILNPFAFIQESGVSQTKDFLKVALRACLTAMHSSQYLNFRSLDMRSDEFPVGGGIRERNPDLGLHGIRRLLQEPALLHAELLVVKELVSEGWQNLVYSLPFISLREELDAVLQIAHDLGIHDVPMSIFVETPAAVIELPALIDAGVRNVFIGTKDLTQMILSCDRSNSRLAHLADPKKGPVLAAIGSVIGTCARQNVPVYLFSSLEDGSFFLHLFPSLSGISICCGEYERLLEAFPAAA